MSSIGGIYPVNQSFIKRYPLIIGEGQTRMTDNLTNQTKFASKQKELLTKIKTVFRQREAIRNIRELKHNIKEFVKDKGSSDLEDGCEREEKGAKISFEQ